MADQICQSLLGSTQHRSKQAISVTVGRSARAWYVCVYIYIWFNCTPFCFLSIYNFSNSHKSSSGFAGTGDFHEIFVTEQEELKTAERAADTCQCQMHTDWYIVQ